MQSTFQGPGFPRVPFVQAGMDSFGIDVIVEVVVEVEVLQCFLQWQPLCAQLLQDYLDNQDQQ